MKEKKTLGVLAFVFIFVGLLLTLENLKIIPGISVHWPVFLFVVGIGFGIMFFQQKKKDAFLIWISSLLVLLGIFFYYLNFTSWIRLATLWTIFLGIVGLSFLSAGIFVKNKLLLSLAVLFITLFLALYLVFTISLKLWPLSFVVFGISLLIIDYFNKKND